MSPYFYLLRVDQQPDVETVTWSSTNEIAVDYARTLLERAAPQKLGSCAVAAGEPEADLEWLGVWDWTPESGPVWTPEEGE